MNFLFLITLEILAVVVAPLLVLYLRSTWPQKSIMICVTTIPLLWYLTYAPIHELSHVAGTLLAGGHVASMKLIPSFWQGEVARAWITTEGLQAAWQWALMTSFPYLLDVLSLVFALIFLRRQSSTNAFVIGLLVMLLVLRPSFDFVSELTGLVSGYKGDYAALENYVGTTPVWASICASILLSAGSIAVMLQRFRSAPGTGQA